MLSGETEILNQLLWLWVVGLNFTVTISLKSLLITLNIYLEYLHLESHCCKQYTAIFNHPIFRVWQWSAKRFLHFFRTCITGTYNHNHLLSGISMMVFFFSSKEPLIQSKVLLQPIDLQWHYTCICIWAIWPISRTHAYRYTVKPFLKDHPMGHTNVVSEDRWSLVAGSITLQYRTFSPKYLVFQDRWSFIAVVSQEMFHCTT